MTSRLMIYKHKYNFAFDSWLIVYKVLLTGSRVPGCISPALPPRWNVRLGRQHRERDQQHCKH